MDFCEFEPIVRLIRPKYDGSKGHSYKDKRVEHKEPYQPRRRALLRPLRINFDAQIRSTNFLQAVHNQAVLV